MNRLYYRIKDNRLWDTETAQFVETAPEDAGIVNLVCSGTPADEIDLANTLSFYRLPLGELVDKSEASIRESLQKLDAEFLTPRTLSGLATNDPIALERWGRHESAAIPLRAKLAALLALKEES